MKSILIVLLLFGINNLIEAQRNFHDFTVKSIDGKEVKMSSFKGKKILVVNIASKCGLTPQLECLQTLYEKMDTSEFVIIAFPANNFLKQEPGTSEEIIEFCTKNYGVTFPVMEKVSVCDYTYLSYPPTPEKSETNETHELYKWLTSSSENGKEDVTVQWNFHKFLVDENGQYVGNLKPTVCEDIDALINGIKN